MQLIRVMTLLPNRVSRYTALLLLLLKNVQLVIVMLQFRAEIKSAPFSLSVKILSLISAVISNRKKWIREQRR